MKIKLFGALVALFVLAASGLTGCTKPPAPGTQAAPAPGAAPAASGSVTIKGSDTMVHLVAKWTESYAAKDSTAKLGLTGGGSGTGIAALINGQADICMSSRDMSAKEKEEAKAKGHETVEHTVALDGIAIVVHPSNPLNDITMDQLAKIYTGEITNWKDVGGPDQPLIALSRESTSGTYVFFQEHVLAKKDYAPGVRLMTATTGIVQGVETDAGAIGYVGLGYAHGAAGKVKILPVKATADAPAVAPTIETVRSKQYSIARALYFYTVGTPTGTVKSFLDYCMGPEGQKIVEEEGYVALQ